MREWNCVSSRGAVLQLKAPYESHWERERQSEKVGVGLERVNDWFLMPRQPHRSYQDEDRKREGGREKEREGRERE